MKVPSHQPSSGGTLCFQLQATLSVINKTVSSPLHGGSGNKNFAWTRVVRTAIELTGEIIHFCKTDSSVVREFRLLYSSLMEGRLFIILLN